MKTLIIGLGAIGMALADSLASNGLEPTISTRIGPVVQDSQINKARVIEVEDRRREFLSELDSEVDSLTSHRALSKRHHQLQQIDLETRPWSAFDVVFVCVKSSSLEQVLTFLARHQCSLPVVLVQNGLLASQLAKEYGSVGTMSVESSTARRTPLKIMLMLTRQSAIRLAPNKVRRTGSGVSDLAPITQTKLDIDLANEIADFLGRCDWQTIRSSDVLTAVWEKLSINVAINGLTALLLVPNGGLLESSAAAQLADSCVRELVAVAAREGIFLSLSDLCQKWRKVASMTAQNASSTLQDTLGQRRSEISSMNGSIANLGGKYRIPTPTNELISQLMIAREQSYGQQASFIDLRLRVL